MFTKEKLETNQIRIYFISFIVAIAFSLCFPSLATSLEIIVSWVIGILMYSMFSQIPFTSLKDSLQNKRFLGALVVVNYLFVPFVVWGLCQLLPNQPSLLLGVYLVLLTPCIDYVIVFTALGGGNERLMLMATPFLFITQLLLLPFYLWMFLGKSAASLVQPGPFIEAFMTFIVLPLLLAITLQYISRKVKLADQCIQISGWLPTPMMALTLFVVVASQLNKVLMDIGLISKVVPIYILFMFIMPFISKLVATFFSLDIKDSRALIFSGSTRNSLVVLALVSFLPNETGTLVAAVIITQTMVELVGELIYIYIVPNILLKEKRT